MFESPVQPVTDSFRLAGAIDDQVMRDLARQVGERLQAQPGTQIVLDCARVTGFSGLGIAALSGLIKGVREQQSELVLRNLAPHIQETFLRQLVDTFLPASQAREINELLETARHLSRSCVRQANFSSVQ